MFGRRIPVPEIRYTGTTALSRRVEPPESVPPLTSMPPGPGNACPEYATRTTAELGPDITAGLNDMAAQGWRLVTVDGERYIFERPARDTPDVHER